MREVYRDVSRLTQKGQNRRWARKSVKIAFGESLIMLAALVLALLFIGLNWLIFRGKGGTDQGYEEEEEHGISLMKEIVLLPYRLWHLLEFLLIEPLIWFITNCVVLPIGRIPGNFINWLDNLCGEPVCTEK